MTTPALRLTAAAVLGGEPVSVSVEQPDPAGVTPAWVRDALAYLVDAAGYAVGMAGAAPGEDVEVAFRGATPRGDYDLGVLRYRVRAYPPGHAQDLDRFFRAEPLFRGEGGW